MGVDPLVGGIGSKLDFVFGFSKFLPGHGLLVRGDRGCRYILVDFLLNLCSSFESISFQFDEHFLLHESAVFVSHFIVPSFEDYVIVSQFLQISIEFLLLLLDPLMMHFVEIFLLQQFFVGPFCLFGHYYRLIEFLFQLPDLVLQVLALLVLKGYFLDSFGHGAFFLHLVPLLLEIVKGVVHLVLDKEFPEE